MTDSKGLFSNHDAIVMNNIQKNARLSEILYCYLLKRQYIARVYFINNPAFGCSKFTNKFFCRFEWLHRQETILHKLIHYLKIIFMCCALTHFEGRINHKGTHVLIQAHAELIEQIQLFQACLALIQF